MIFKPEDFPADYVTKELAAKVANELFQEYIKEQGICTHPIEKISGSYLSWRLKDCDFRCECGQRMIITKWIPSLEPIQPKIVERGYENEIAVPV